MAERKENNISSVMESLMKSADALFTTKTVVGEAMKIDDTVIIPLMDVSFGIGAGATGNNTSTAAKNNGIGGMHGKMSPTVVLMIKNGQTRMISVKNTDTVSKIVDMIPDIVDKFTVKKEEMISDEEAVNAAFPEEETSKE